MAVCRAPPNVLARDRRGIVEVSVGRTSVVEGLGRDCGCAFNRA